MTTLELGKAIGKQAIWAPRVLFGISIEVLIYDARVSYGRTQYKISPVSGSGFIWVDELSIKIE